MLSLVAINTTAKSNMGRKWVTQLILIGHNLPLGKIRIGAQTGSGAETMKNAAYWLLLLLFDTAQATCLGHLPTVGWVLPP